MKNRSFRRFQLEKKKKEAMGRFWYADTPRMIGILANTPCPYSDQDHGHARFWHGDTRQEKAVKLDYEQEKTDMLTDYTW
jgi:hypothetical protein